MTLALRSRSGCQRCRCRRIKCDETRPICARCRKSNLECTWADKPQVMSQFLKSQTTLGNLYANIHLKSQHYIFDEQSTATSPLQACPVKSLSPGWIPLRSIQEHYTLIRLSKLLAMLDPKCSPGLEPEPHFPLTVALQELWVRDALIAFAKITMPNEEYSISISASAQPYYHSAISNVRRYISYDMDAERLEKLLVATLFLGMMEFNNPENKIFPLLHFETVGYFLDSLHRTQGASVLPVAIARFHRIAFESYVYHTSIQALFYPQVHRPVALSALVDQDIKASNMEQGRNALVTLDLRMYVALFQLTQLAGLKTLDDAQQGQAKQLDEKIRSIEAKALAKLQTASSDSNPMWVNFWAMTALASGTLLILSAKILDRTLETTDAAIRPLVNAVLTRMEATKLVRGYTGDWIWIFAVLACGVHTVGDYERMSHKLLEISARCGSADLRRIERVLNLTRAWRKARAENKLDETGGRQNNDPLDLLVEGRLFLA